MKNNKAKIRVNKLNNNPLFIKFLNWQGDKYFIEKTLEILVESFENIQDQEIVLDKLNNLSDNYLLNLSNFQKAFKNYLQLTISTQNISEDFIIWMNNAFKYVEERISSYGKDETRTLTIKDRDGQWFEGIILFNFIMTFNYFGIGIIKRCPICSNFFSHKGKYAKYCSAGCKTTGMKK